MNDADKKLLELAEKANAQGLLPMTVFRCEFDRETEPDVACGFNGCILDASNDECHHVLSLAEANYIVAAANAVPRLIAENERLRKHIKAAHAICEVVACKDEPVGRAAQRWLTADAAAAKESSHE